MNIKAVIGIVISALSLALTFSPSHAQTAGEILKAYESLKKPERKTRLVEGAKKEGRLVVYGTLGVDAARPMLEKFRQAHPYISIGHYRSGSTGIYNRVVNEGRAGKHEVDIIELSAGPVSELIRGGFADPYRSPETDAVRPEFIDPRHLWNAYHYLVVGLAYNKNLVKSSEVPKTYQDLLLPRWRGRKMSLDRDAGDVFGALLDSWGRERRNRLLPQAGKTGSSHSQRLYTPGAASRRRRSGNRAVVPFAKAVVDGRFRGAARHRILGAGSFKSPSIVAGASRGSSPRRGAVHRLGAFRGRPSICRDRYRAQPGANR